MSRAQPRYGQAERGCAVPMGPAGGQAGAVVLVRWCSGAHPVVAQIQLLRVVRWKAAGRNSRGLHRSGERSRCAELGSGALKIAL